MTVLKFSSASSLPSAMRERRRWSGVMSSTAAGKRSARLSAVYRGERLSGWMPAGGRRCESVLKGSLVIGVGVRKVIEIGKCG
jgi:hypothetical protein